MDNNPSDPSLISPYVPEANSTDESSVRSITDGKANTEEETTSKISEQCNVQDGVTDCQCDTSTFPKAGLIKRKRGQWSHRRIMSMITNFTHMTFSLTIILLGVSSSWYHAYTNRSSSYRVNYVIFSCVIYLICGVYGVIINFKKLRKSRRHFVSYISVSMLCVIASIFIITAIVRNIWSSENYRSNNLALKILDSGIIVLATLDFPAVGLSVYYTLYKSSRRLPSLQIQLELAVSSSYGRTKHKKNTQKILLNIINVAQILFGVCVSGLALVGMLHQRQMNMQNGALFAAVFLSLIFIASGGFGVHCITTENIIDNYIWYSGSCLIAGLCAAVNVVLVILSMTDKYYYTGFDVVVAFDYMILCLSGAEILVAVLCIILVGYIYVLKPTKPRRETDNSLQESTTTDSSLHDTTDHSSRSASQLNIQEAAGHTSVPPGDETSSSPDVGATTNRSEEDVTS